MSFNDPTAWANKRKAAIENAKKLREERAKGINTTEELPSFTPKINSRPSYLGKQVDSLDRLTNDIQHDPNNIFEQPLPGNRSKSNISNQHDNYNGGVYNITSGISQLSPGCDTLGKEMKNYPGPSNNNMNRVNIQTNNENHINQSQYKSKFLKQYDINNNNDLTAVTSINNQNTHQYSSNSSNNKKAAMNITNTTVVKDEDIDEAFFSSLRGGSKASGPGWNDDTTSNGFAPVSSTQLKSSRIKSENNKQLSSNNNIRPKPIQQQQQQFSNYDSNNNNGEQQPSRSSYTIGSQANQRRTVKDTEWNMDTEIISPRDSNKQFQYQQQQTNGRELPIKISPRNSMAANVSSNNNKIKVMNSGDVSQIKPNLSLLKSKIKRSESGNGLRSNSSSRTNNVLNTDDDDYYHESSLPLTERDNRSAPGGYSTNNIAYENRAMNNRNNNGSSRNTNNLQSVVNREKSNVRVAAMGGSSNSAMITNKQSSNMNDYGSNDIYNSPNDNKNYNNFSNRTYEQPPQQQPSSNMYDDDAGDLGEQLQCPDCGRKFNPAPYQKHIKICAKVFLQKRKVFDSTKMRTKDDPELAKLAQQALKKEQMLNKKKALVAASSGAMPMRNPDIKQQQLALMSKPTNSNAGDNKSAKWRDQSNAFREAMKAARQVTVAIAEGKPLPPPIISAPDPSLIPCPHCNRRFNAKAAERHIPQCQNIIAKPTKLKRGSGGNATNANAIGRKSIGRSGF